LGIIVGHSYVSSSNNLLHKSMNRIEWSCMVVLYFSYDLLDDNII